MDADKSKWDVLLGIRPDDWPKIRQIVIEAHDIDGRLGLMTELLGQHGYRVTVEQDQVPERMGIYMVYAVRVAGPPRGPARVRDDRPSSDTPTWSSPASWSRVNTACVAANAIG